MRHVSSDQMSGREGTAKTELSSKNAGSNYACKFSSIITGNRRMGTTDAEQVKTCTLRFKDCTSSNGSNLNRGHGHGYLKIPIHTDIILAHLKHPKLSGVTHFRMIVMQLLLSTFCAGS